VDVLNDLGEIAHIEPLFHVMIGLALSDAVKVRPGVARMFSGHDGAFLPRRGEKPLLIPSGDRFAVSAYTDLC
jgi:hypothetical protein